MAEPKPTQEETRVKSDANESSVARDFVYRDGMGVNEVAQYLNTDWEDAYSTINDLLDQAEDDDE